MHRIPRHYQVEGITWLTTPNVLRSKTDIIPTLCRHLLRDDPGAGKGHPDSTNILTPTGWKQIKELQVGDKVIGKDGTPVNVTGVFPRGELPVYKVSFNDSSSVLVDADHIWTVSTKNNMTRYGGKWTNLQTKDLDDCMYQGLYIPLITAPVEFDITNTSLPLDPYLLGVLIGDGSMTGHTVSITTGDEDVPAEVQKVLPEGVTLNKHSDDVSWGFSSIPQYAPNPVMVAVRSLQLDCLSIKKFIPDQYKFSSPAQRLSLLQGLMDTDGWTQRNSTCFGTSSKQLAKDVVFLIQSFGGTARVAEKFSQYTKQDGERVQFKHINYTVTINLPNHINPFRAHAYKHIPHEKYTPSRVMTRVTPAGTANVICLSVDAKDQLYVTEDCIVTHNTFQSSEAAQLLTPNAHSIVVIAPAHLTKQWFEFWGEQYPTDSIVWLEGGLSKKSKELRQKARVYIISTQSFRFEKYLELYTQLFIDQHVDTVIIDESHYCKNPDASTSQNIRKITRPDFVDNVILLSATPIMKEADDLFMQLRIMDPHTFTRHDLFLNEYCFFTWTSYGAQDVTLRSDAQRKLKPWIWGRTYAQIGLELPPIISQVQTHLMIPQRKKAYDNIKLYWATLVSNPTYNAQGDAVLTANSAMEVMHMLRHIISSPEKQSDLANYLETDPGPYLIACFYRDSARELEQYIKTNLPAYNPIIITGETPANDRAKLAQQQSGPKDIVIATIPSISEGCDLSHCNTVYFYESDFTPGKMHQFLSRVRRHRDNTEGTVTITEDRKLEVTANPNERPVIVRYFHADRSIDQHIHAVLDRRSVSVRELIKVELGVS